MKKPILPLFYSSAVRDVHFKLLLTCVFRLTCSYKQVLLLTRLWAQRTAAELVGLIHLTLLKSLLFHMVCLCFLPYALQLGLKMVFIFVCLFVCSWAGSKAPACIVPTSVASPFLRCSTLLLPRIVMNFSSSVPNLPSPAANKSCNSRGTPVFTHTQPLGRADVRAIMNERGENNTSGNGFLVSSPCFHMETLHFCCSLSFSIFFYEATILLCEKW